jgi:hypothetical protein
VCYLETSWAHKCAGDSCARTSFLCFGDPLDDITCACTRQLLFCRDISAGVFNGALENLVDLAGGQGSNLLTVQPGRTAARLVRAMFCKVAQKCLLYTQPKKLPSLYITNFVLCIFIGILFANSKMQKGHQVFGCVWSL